MTVLLAILEFSDYAVIGLIACALIGGINLATRQRRDVRRLERKLDALIQHHGVTLQWSLSPEVQRLANDPSRKIAAIKLHRKQNPGLSLADAKEEVEDFRGDTQ
jgi:hypothetical protein